MCKCGCNTCETKVRGPLLTESKVKSLLSENLQYHIDKQIPLFETVFRIGSNAHLKLIKEARKMYSRNVIDLCEEDEHLIKTHLGEFALYENESVPLDLPMLEEAEIDEAEFKGKEVPLGKPKRGGSKKYYVYVKNPKTGRVKKVSFGDTSGLSAKIRNKDARTAFAARHDCKNKKDRTKAGYWSCNLPRYATALGLGANMSTYW
jgi:ribosomal protein L37AE/L43A